MSIQENVNNSVKIARPNYVQNNLYGPVLHPYNSKYDHELQCQIGKRTDVSVDITPEV